MLLSTPSEVVVVVVSLLLSGLSLSWSLSVVVVVCSTFFFDNDDWFDEGASITLKSSVLDFDLYPSADTSTLTLKGPGVECPPIGKVYAY
jgi:hypothetical protein